MYAEHVSPYRYLSNYQYYCVPNRHGGTPGPDKVTTHLLLFPVIEDPRTPSVKEPWVHSGLRYRHQSRHPVSLKRSLPLFGVRVKRQKRIWHFLFTLHFSQSPVLCRKKGGREGRKNFINNSFVMNGMRHDPVSLTSYADDGRILERQISPSTLVVARSAVFLRAPATTSPCR